MRFPARSEQPKKASGSGTGGNFEKTVILGNLVGSKAVVHELKTSGTWAQNLWNMDSKPVEQVTQNSFNKTIARPPHTFSVAGCLGTDGGHTWALCQPLRTSKTLQAVVHHFKKPWNMGSKPVEHWTAAGQDRLHSNLVPISLKSPWNPPKSFDQVT